MKKLLGLPLVMLLIAPVGTAQIGTFTYVNVTTTTTGYQLGGTTVVKFPYADNSSIAIGTIALASQNTGNLGNTAVGSGSGTAIISSHDNTAVGYNSLWSLSSGIGYNTAVGSVALFSNVANYCTAVGGQAARYFSAVAGQIDAFGYEAGYYDSTGNSNLFVGYQAGFGSNSAPTTGNANAVIGYQALRSLQGAGAKNTALGYQAGYYGTALTTGTGNLLLGYHAAVAGATDTNEIVAGASATGQGSNTVTLGNSSIGAIYAQVTTITGLSDRRKKKDVEDADLGLNFIAKLRPVSYRYKNGDNTLRYGFIAQDVEKALPKLLQARVESQEPGHGIALITRKPSSVDKDRSYEMGYSELIAPLVKAIQEQQAEIEELKKEVAALKAK